MTSLWLRVGLVVALIASLFVGIWDFFRTPSVETAVAAVIPTVEKVERARAVTDPVVQFVSEQDAESVEQLVRQADAEFEQSLSQPGAPVEIVNKVREITDFVKASASPDSTLQARATIAETAPEHPAGSVTVEPGREPGIEWYRDN